jgi:imidazolonepropionase-like amidohydrolase
LETTMSSPPDGILVIKNGTLIDGTGGKPRRNGRIVIRGGKIAEVGPEGPFDQSGGAGVIDAVGSFILPGLIDGHVHLSMFQGAPPGIGGSDQRRVLHAARGPELDADPSRGVY